MFSNSIKIIIFCFSTLFVPGKAAFASVEDTLPNILIIITDDQGYHDVSYYGTEDIETPNIDQIAAGGMRFDYFYSNSPVCAPTRASLLSGRYPDHVGVPGLIRQHPENSWGYLDPDAVLLPTMLKRAGYNTAHVGKWNLGLESPNLPNDRGFDHFHGWLEDMMDDYWTHLRFGGNYMRLNDQVIDPEGHATDLFTQWSVEYIEKQTQEKEPFFLYLAYNAPHTPIQPPEEWLKKVKEREPGMAEERAALVALIEHMDDGIGKIIKTLKETGQYENTLIVFTSDNGGLLNRQANNGPMRGGKADMYEGGLRVPTSIMWPDKIKANTVSGQVNLSMDLYPTLLEAANVELEHTIEGRSFLDTLLKKSMDEEKRPLYFTRREGGTRYGGKAYYALRLEDWKLLQNRPYQPMELYNLKEDPLEEDNLLEEMPEIYDKLNNLLMQNIQNGGRIPWQGPENQ